MITNYKSNKIKVDICPSREVLFEKFSPEVVIESVYLKEFDGTVRIYRHNEMFGGYYIYSLEESFSKKFELHLYDDGNIFHIGYGNIFKEPAKKIGDIDKIKELLRKISEKYTGFPISELNVVINID